MRRRLAAALAGAVTLTAGLPVAADDAPGSRACAAGTTCQHPAPSIRVVLPSGIAHVSVSAGADTATLIVGTNTSPYDVRFSGFGFTEERVLARFDGVAAACVPGEMREGTVHIFDGASEASMRLEAACGSALSVH